MHAIRRPQGGQSANSVTQGQNAFDSYDKYKLWGQLNKVQYAYDSEKYGISIAFAPPKPDLQKHSRYKQMASSGSHEPIFNVLVQA